ncbi:MAG TPA: hypothetical protein DDZ80_25340 [Cyanobacteria bacterium UBA8803]|nr:hypothetical protein [Cyanobacteria bacterium UBA9273]HBL61619.1 hypothetical protein [Cyanobacteria bacterium UBA8803]
MNLKVIAVFSLVVLSPLLASAHTSAPIPSLVPLEVEFLAPNALPPRPGVITANSISQTQITTPSLWWAEEQFNEFGGKLLTNWIAYQDEKRVDLVVNRQPWTLLNYLERYRFVNRFGTVGRDYQYNVRVFNDRAAMLATYTCNYSKAQPDCELLIFDSLGQDGLPVRRQ